MSYRLTPNCREGKCQICTGCSHTCHGVPMPEGFRAAVLPEIHAATAKLRAEAEAQEARS